MDASQMIRQQAIANALRGQGRLPNALVASNPQEPSKEDLAKVSLEGIVPPEHIEEAMLIFNNLIKQGMAKTQAMEQTITLIIDIIKARSKERLEQALKEEQQPTNETKEDKNDE